MITDRIGDFIIRLQNAALIGKRKVAIPYSAHLAAIAGKLKEIGFLAAVEVKESRKAEDGHAIKKCIAVELAYDKRGEAKLRGVKRVSKPGRRLYASHTSVHKVKGGTGARILSSSIGIISDVEARKNRVGGEELFEIW